MKVTDAKDIRAVGAGTRPATSRPEESDRAARERVSTDDSERLTKIVATSIQSAGAVRAARLEEIEAAVRQGTYRPDPQRIAHQILDDAELAARLHALLVE